MTLSFTPTKHPKTKQRNTVDGPERQRDRETERQRDRETERQRDRAGKQAKPLAAILSYDPIL